MGLPAVSKTFKTRHEADVWYRPLEHAQDRGVFVNRAEADKATAGECVGRYIQEVTPQKRSAKNDRPRMLFLKRHLFADSSVLRLASGQWVLSVPASGRFRCGCLGASHWNSRTRRGVSQGENGVRRQR
jgi:hypothetical protein